MQPPVSLIAAAMLATCTPALLAYSASPSATFLNQAAAVIGWGIFLFKGLTGRKLITHRLATLCSLERCGLPLALFILIVLASAEAMLGSLPMSLSLPSVLMLAAAWWAAVVGMMIADAEWRIHVFRSLAWSMVTAGLLAVVIGSVQVFLPDWTDGRWVATSALEGRATGNFRQPNHLGTLLSWAVVALVALYEMNHSPLISRAITGSAVESRAVTSEDRPDLWAKADPLLSAKRSSLYLQTGSAWLGTFFLVMGIVLSASRTAAVALLLLAIWGWLDRRLSRNSRVLLGATPVLYAFIWMGLTVWADATGHAFGGAARFSMQGNVSSSRFEIWTNTLSLIVRHPWDGVGWGGFNFAWSLTPFPDRPTAFFDHTHNLALQLAVELGLPAAGLVLALLACAFWRAGLVAHLAELGPKSVVLRCGWMMLLLVMLHSQLEYPLWYAYFLLPTAFIWGLCLDAGRGVTDPNAQHTTSRSDRWLLPALRMGAVLIGIVGAAAVLDYRRVAVIFSPPPGARPLNERIETGEHSPLFAHHAYYAQATTATLPDDVSPQALQVATHHLLDTRLMMAWAKALNARGDVERARHLAARLREFHNPSSQTFFEPCDQSSLTKDEPLPFQCTLPTVAMDWRDFK